MPIKWKKKGNRFVPEVILDKIDEVRTVGADGSVSFSGMEIEDYLPTLESHLEFPSITSGMDKSILVWKTVAKTAKPLTPQLFIKSINSQLDSLLSVKEQTYVLLTEISLDYFDIPNSIVRNGIEIKFWRNDFPAKFRKARLTLISDNRVTVDSTPYTFCKVTVSVKAKSPSLAYHLAMRELDTQRALWCLMKNPSMQFTFGAGSNRPVNTVRLGSRHTLHTVDGEPAFDAIWYEPNFVPASIVRFSDPKVVLKNSNFAVRRMESCSYGEQLKASLVMYVRALDENDANTSFLRLWGAIEALTTPGVAVYESLVKRCSFLYADSAYHRQVLEHLREYRNASVHAGEESNKARTHCFQLQRYYRDLFWFLTNKTKLFKNLSEANHFLDSSENPNELKHQMKMIQMAIKFRESKEI